MDNKFIEFIQNNVAEGQQNLAEIGRTLVYKRAPTLFDALDFDDDEPFLEPLLFACVTSGEGLRQLEQVLFGYIEDSLKPPEIVVRSNSEGIVHLPRLGNFTTHLPERDIRLKWDSRRRACSFDANGVTLEPIHEQAPRVAGGRIEVSLHCHPLLSRFFADAHGRRVEVEIEAITRRQIERLNTAFELVRRFHPEYYATILEATRRVVIFRSDHVNSFTSLSAHGAAFMNARRDDDEVFFLEDIAHQCGHVVFSALTFRPQDFLAIAPDTVLSSLTGRESEKRTVYEAFHGVFTEALMMECLDACFDQALLSESQMHELTARMAFILRRFGSDLHNLCGVGVFTEVGEWVFMNISRVFKDMYQRRWDVLRHLDISNQPYTFNYEKFVERNGPPSSHRDL